MGKANESSLSTPGNTICHHSTCLTASSGACLSSTSSKGCSCASHRDCSRSGGPVPGADSPSDGASHASLEQNPPSALTSAFRWSLEYDLCVCHSTKDDQEAVLMVSYLEATVRSLRCFLPPRDCPLGSSVPTELYRAVQSSHCWVLLITSHFLQDDWCLYQMHQALSEAPMSNRIIPTLLHLPYSKCPKELRFFYMIDLSQKASQDHGYDLVYKAVLQCEYKSSERFYIIVLQKGNDYNFYDIWLWHLFAIVCCWITWITYCICGSNAHYWGVKCSYHSSTVWVYRRSVINWKSILNRQLTDSPINQKLRCKIQEWMKQCYCEIKDKYFISDR